MFEEHSILYVEDDATSRRVMQMLLELVIQHSAFTILEDSTGFDERLNTLHPRPDIIFLDIHVRPFDGFEMLKMIRSHPAYADSRVVALTASVMNEEVEQLEAAGFDGAIAKPLRKDMFAQILEQIINGERIWFVG